MKKLICFVLSALLVSASTVPALAAVATSSNSDFRLEDYLDNYKKIPLPADNPGLGVVPDTALHTMSDSDIWMNASDDKLLTDDVMTYGAEVSSYFYIPWAEIHDSNGNYVKTVRGTYTDYPGVSDNLGLYNWPELPDGQKYVNLFYSLPKAALPSPGSYGVSWSFREFDIALQWHSVSLVVRAHKNGVAEAAKSVYAKFTNFENTGHVYCESNVQIGYNTSTINLVVGIQPTSNLAICVPVNNAFQFSFNKFEGSETAVSPDISSGSSSAGDSIAGSSQQIAQNTATMNDTLKEIVQTISKQLEALWNQQYNYIHLEDMANADKNADKIVNALGNEITVQIDNDNRISQDIMANDDKNTDTVVNGYDGSGIDSDNNRLNNSINEYESAESAVLDKVNKELGNFEFQNSFQGYVNSITVISSFLQRLYDNSGAFKDVINIGFFLSIASIVIGMYRFKEG